MNNVPKDLFVIIPVQAPLPSRKRCRCPMEKAEMLLGFNLHE